MSEQIKAELEQNDIKLEQLIDSMGIITMHFNGMSMRPMLRDRKDLVVIQKITRPLQKNDVPVYRMPSGKVIMHRIIKIKDGKYIIRGDNLLQKEYDVTDRMIFGVLKGFYRGKKYIDCHKSIGYKLYVLIFRKIYYALKYLWHKILRPFASKIKHTIFK